MKLEIRVPSILLTNALVTGKSGRKSIKQKFERIITVNSFMAHIHGSFHF